MRFGWNLELRGSNPLGGLLTDSANAESAGFDMVWYSDEGGLHPAAVAAAIAPVTVGLRVGVTALVGVENPVELAEEMTVADHVLGGRLVLAVRAAEHTAGRVPEVLDLLLESFGSHPFRHGGPIWPTPANLAENIFNLEDRVRVTPPPVQFELPLLVAGVEGRDAAVERGLGFVLDAEESGATVRAWWQQVKDREPLLVRRIRRTATWVPPTRGDRIDAGQSVIQLRALQRDIGLDLVVVRAPPPLDPHVAMLDIARLIRPRVQLDRLPPGLEYHWTTQPADEIARPRNEE
jgi:alkanesulfonate monooxygenase SsuD/methylene tetrahydromethanopterin reductase-like flavin-dependent oxidoreductase (luciferase family)